MTIEALVAAVPPPSQPSEAFGGPWKVMEGWLGTALPQDYKDFVRVYGNGYFLQFLGVHTPHTRNPYTRLEQQVGAICRIFADLGEESPYPFWPEPGGLVPFGVTDNGDYLFWHSAGATPEDWKVVVWHRGGMDLDAYEEFDCGLTDFLAGLATGEVTPKAFPDDLLPCERPFIPDSEFPDAPLDAGDGKGSERPLQLRWRTRFAWPSRVGW